MCVLWTLRQAREGRSWSCWRCVGARRECQQHCASIATATKSCCCETQARARAPPAVGSRDTAEEVWVMAHGKITYYKQGLFVCHCRSLTQQCLRWKTGCDLRSYVERHSPGTLFSILNCSNASTNSKLCHSSWNTGPWGLKLWSVMWKKCSPLLRIRALLMRKSSQADASLGGAGAARKQMANRPSVRHCLAITRSLPNFALKPCNTDVRNLPKSLPSPVHQHQSSCKHLLCFCVAAALVVCSSWAMALFLCAQSSCRTRERLLVHECWME